MATSTLASTSWSEEVLEADTHECAAQLIVSAYMLSSPAGRATAVRSAIDELDGIDHFTAPIQDMERAAVEPLPLFESWTF